MSLLSPWFSHRACVALTMCIHTWQKFDSLKFLLRLTYTFLLYKMCSHIKYWHLAGIQHNLGNTKKATLSLWLKIVVDMLVDLRHGCDVLEVMMDRAKFETGQNHRKVFIYV